MRIRLQVLRHQLPPTKVLWKVDAATTTAELLTQISDFFPLESEGWGLEDYAVHLGGYELLHFQQLGDVLKEDDEISIQPLQTNDIRARNLSGRHQISRDGRHLVDGIAFGRPLLRAPAHAPIHIPPRKRARLDPSLEESDAALQLGDYGPSPSDPGPRLRTKTQKHVTFSPEFLQADYDDNGDMIFDDYDDGEDDEDDHDFELPSDDDLDDQQDSNMKLLQDVDRNSATDQESSSDNDSDYSSDSDDDSSGSDSDAPSEEPINKGSSSIEALVKSNPVTAQPTKQTPAKQVAPSDGKQRTRARNRRRRDAKKLAWLKSKGHLPATANRQDLKKWKEDNEAGRVSASDFDSDDEPSSSDSSSSSDSDSESESETEQTEKAAPPVIKKPAIPMVPRQLKVKPKAKKPLTDNKSEEFTQKREALLAALQSGGVELNNDLSTPPVDAIMSDAGPSTMPASENNTTPQRRARLDLASSNRLLFNSLGVRAPKNDADRQRLQAKLAAQTTRKPVTKPTTPAAPTKEPTRAEEEEGSTDVDAWKSRISLSAVECAPGQEEYYYSTPPFPFYQRWDPSQRTKKRKRGSQAVDPSLLQSTEEILDNSYSEYYNTGTNGDALNYGDDEDEVGGGAAAAPETDQEAATAQLLAESSEAADLPALPSDLSTLAPLTPETTLPGAIITFTQFEVSAATNWTPAMSPIRTASIIHVSTDVSSGTKSLGLQLAKRDIPGRKYDSQGRRLFDKFEMIVGDEEDEDIDDGFVEVEVAELIDPRLLKAAEDEQKSVEDGKVMMEEEEQVPEVIGVAL
ncbi:hypothetical protein M436DRAFT_43904 [Aureobasidium namibiae CBS 147.97]|uniref:DUF7357 domain-containing protein n=1 Tax=Aureobasidium namibiae CBS 147.97 TaxID=1043004 RepID=A0A074WMG0_9PEZI|nr:uncharacterized protein M436DRAFT_43904 [Aureobasidium namibiae CBS 147.97]KEQ74300.1 hypothetical protein M436DRAFT_43904 [Aureobasidium namibiae CBS 147.97]